MEVSGKKANIGTFYPVGYCCTKGQKEDGHNQDDFGLIIRPGIQVLSVFDGHGPCGHTISNYVQRYIGDHMINLKETQKVGEVLKHAFLEAHESCKREEATVSNSDLFDSANAGTTATVVVVVRSTLTVAHVGDSRAILATERSRGPYKLTELTNDHSTSRKDEKKRIIAAGGILKRLDGDVPYRVFVRGQGYPGLAMTRAIGDTSGEDAGIIPTPEISQFHLDRSRRNIVVVASDGVWEFLSSQHVVDIVSMFEPKTAKQAAAKVVEEATKRWNSNSPWAVDDITCIVLFV